MDFNTYCIIWICIIGLCMGSFYNVVILRSLSGESIVFPSSKCPKCGNKLKPWHNIPILSYILLRGKCYFCKEKISIQYPVVEFITMLLFCFSYWRFGLSISTVFVIIWLSMLLIMTVTDLKERLVDCRIAIAMGISGCISAFIINGVAGLISSVLGIIAGIIIFETIARCGKFIFHTDVMGEADTYVAAAIGGIFGVYNLPIVLLLGLLSYALIFLPLFIYDKFKLKDYATVISFFIFFACAIVQLLMQNYCSYLLLIVSTIIFIINIYRGLDKKNKREIPYVPAFSTGTLLFIIFFVQDLSYDNSILSDTITKLLYF